MGRKCGAEREEQTTDRPGRQDGESGEEEGAANDIQYAPAKAAANRTSRTTNGRTRGAEPSCTRDDETRAPRPMPLVLTTPVASATPAGSRRGCRSRSAALAALTAAPVAKPWSPR